MSLLNGGKLDISIFRSKTFWTALVTVAVSIGQAIGFDVPDGLQGGLMGVLFIFLRMGVNKT